MLSSISYIVGTCGYLKNIDCLSDVFYVTTTYILIKNHSGLNRVYHILTSVDTSSSPDTSKLESTLSFMVPRMFKHSMFYCFPPDKPKTSITFPEMYTFF